MFSNKGSISFFENDTSYGSEVYFRFGTDTSNFYEYRQPVVKGEFKNDGWSEISILFEDLTSIKQDRDPGELTVLFPQSNN